MHSEHGLPSLEDSSYELGLTDPPYNLGFKGIPSSKNEIWLKNQRTKKIWYDDKMSESDYFNWCFSWFEQLKRVSQFIIFTPGYKNFKKWLFQYPELEFGVFTRRTAQGGCPIASFRRFEPYFVWNIQQIRKLHNRLKIAWINIKQIVTQQNCLEYIHPCPKPFELWDRFITELKPVSVIDPFLGSGTTAEVCEYLGIRWLGFEKEERYAPDIEKRVKNGQKKRNVQKLERFLKPCELEKINQY